VEAGGRSRQLTVIVVQGKDTPSVQLCDVLLGAVIAAWQGKVQADDKRQVQQVIAERLDWPSLRGISH